MLRGICGEGELRDGGRRCAGSLARREIVRLPWILHTKSGSVSLPMMMGWVAVEARVVVERRREEGTGAVGKAKAARGARVGVAPDGLGDRTVNSQIAFYFEK